MDEATIKLAKDIAAKGRALGMSNAEIVASAGQALGMSKTELADAVGTYRTYRKNIDNQIRNRQILANPEQLKNWDMKDLLKERDRVDQQIRELQSMKRADDSLKHAINEAKIIKHDLEAKEKYDLKGWDRVEIDEQTLADINKIIRDQFNSHGYDMRNVAVKKLAVTFGDEIYYFSAVSTNLLHIRIWDNFPTIQSFSADFDVKISSNELELFNKKNLSEDMLDFLTQDTDDSGLKNFETTALLYLSINEFMLHYKDVAFNIRVIECKGLSKKNDYSKDCSGKHVIRLVHQYKLKKNWQAKAERKKAEIQCKAWGVRGHFRHYKDGKVVFVEAYVKGKDRDQYQGKVYELLPRRERD